MVRRRRALAAQVGPEQRAFVEIAPEADVDRPFADEFVARITENALD